MTKASWSPQARADLRALVGYLRRRNQAAAERASIEILAAADQLVRFPQMGRSNALPGRRERSLPAWHLVMFYRVIGDSIEISSLRDTRRQPPDQADG